MPCSQDEQSSDQEEQNRGLHKLYDEMTLATQLNTLEKNPRR